MPLLDRQGRAIVSPERFRTHRHPGRNEAECRDHPKALGAMMDSGSVPLERPVRNDGAGLVGMECPQLILQTASSPVVAMTSRLSLGPGTGGEEVKRSHWFLTCAAGSAVIVYISLIS